MGKEFPFDAHQIVASVLESVPLESLVAPWSTSQGRNALFLRRNEINGQIQVYSSRFSTFLRPRPWILVHNYRFHVKLSFKPLGILSISGLFSGPSHLLSPCTHYRNHPYDVTPVTLCVDDLSSMIWLPSALGHPGWNPMLRSSPAHLYSHQYCLLSQAASLLVLPVSGC